MWGTTHPRVYSMIMKEITCYTCYFELITSVFLLFLNYSLESTERFNVAALETFIFYFYTLEYSICLILFKSISPVPLLSSHHSFIIFQGPFDSHLFVTIKLSCMLISQTISLRILYTNLCFNNSYMFLKYIYALYMHFTLENARHPVRQKVTGNQHAVRKVMLRGTNINYVS